LNIWSVLEWLGEVADVAGNVLVSVEGERYDRLHTRSVLYKKAAKTKAEKKAARGGSELTMKQRVNQGWLFITRPEWFPQL